MISTKQPQKLPDIAAVSASIGLPSLVVIDDEKGVSGKRNALEKTLSKSGFVKAGDYLEIMDLLAHGKEKIMYVEKGKKLDGLVLEIAAEYAAGIVSLADRKHNTGLKIAKFSPFKTAFVVAMTRKQVEASYPRLYEYFGSVTSNLELL
ncbi:MAG: hypothetical protein AAB386_02310 [Patescibacteria group bacterium]